MRISDWSSDVCSSDLSQVAVDQLRQRLAAAEQVLGRPALGDQQAQRLAVDRGAAGGPQDGGGRGQAVAGGGEVGAEPCPEAVAEADPLAEAGTSGPRRGGPVVDHGLSPRRGVLPAATVAQQAGQETI